MITKRLMLCALAGSLLVCTAPTIAADGPLNLLDAVERAVEHSPDVDSRVAARDAAQSLVSPAGQLPDPELVFGIDNLPITDPYAGSITRDFMTMRKVGVMQAFPGHAKRDLRTQRASDAEKVAQAEELRTTLDVKRQTAQAWISVYVAEQTLARLRVLEADLELQSQLANAGVKSGRITVADALGSQTALLSLRARIYVAEQNVRHRRAELARWLPDDAARPLADAPSFAQLPKAEVLSNIHRHASLVAYDAHLDAARSEVALAQAEKHPDWSVGLTYAKRGSEFSDMISLEFRVGLPLFSGKRQDPTIAARRADLRRVAADRESELRMHKAEVTQLIADWETLITRTTAFNGELLPLAKERVQLATTALQSGRGDVKSALSAQQDFVELQLQALALEGELGRTWATLNYLQTDRSAP